MRLPCKDTYPDYYNFIKNPMDMETINNRIKSNFYKTIKKFSADVNQMFENCKLPPQETLQIENIFRNQS